MPRDRFVGHEQLQLYCQDEDKGRALVSVCRLCAFLHFLIRRIVAVPAGAGSQHHR